MVEENWTHMAQLVMVWRIVSKMLLYSLLMPQIGNPIGGLVFSNAFTGQFEELHEWTVRTKTYGFHISDSPSFLVS